MIKKLLLAVAVLLVVLSAAALPALAMFSGDCIQVVVVSTDGIGTVEVYSDNEYKPNEIFKYDGSSSLIVRACDAEGKTGNYKITKINVLSGPHYESTLKPNIYFNGTEKGNEPAGGFGRFDIHGSDLRNGNKVFGSVIHELFSLEVVVEPIDSSTSASPGMIVLKEDVDGVPGIPEPSLPENGKVKVETDGTAEYYLYNEKTHGYSLKGNLTEVGGYLQDWIDNGLLAADDKVRVYYDIDKVSDTNVKISDLLGSASSSVSQTGGYVDFTVPKLNYTATVTFTLVPKAGDGDPGIDLDALAAALGWDESSQSFTIDFSLADEDFVPAPDIEYGVNVYANAIAGENTEKTLVASGVLSDGGLSFDVGGCTNTVFEYRPYVKVEDRQTEGEARRTGVYSLLAADIAESSYQSGKFNKDMAAKAAEVFNKGGIFVKNENGSDSLTDDMMKLLKEADESNTYTLIDSAKNIGLFFTADMDDNIAGTNSGQYTTIKLIGGGKVALLNAETEEAVTVYLEEVELVFVPETVTETMASGDVSNAAEFQDIL